MPGGGGKQAQFRGADGEGDGSLDGRALRLTGCGIEAGGNIDGQDLEAGLVDLLDEPHPGRLERAVEADPKQPIDDQCRTQGQEGLEPGEVRLGVADFQQINPAILEMLARGAGVIAVVAFAGQNQDQVRGPGQGQRVARNLQAHTPNDLTLGLPGSPGGLFPLAHLLEAEYRKGHVRAYAAWSVRTWSVERESVVA